MIEFTDNERKEIEKRNKQRIEREADDLRKVLSLVEGRRVLARLLFKACATDANQTMMETSFNPNALSMAFTEGSRRFGMALWNEIWTVSPDKLIQMRREHESDQRSEEEAAKKKAE